MSGETKKKENMHVYLRVRPLNNSEKHQKSHSVVDCINNKEIRVRNPNGGENKMFKFDEVFDPRSAQIDVYKHVVGNIIEEVLAGYNCTVFAYGQTGSGKTYTMEGERSDASKSWLTDPNCGIIPRCLSQLFDGLHRANLVDTTVRVSFLELYNEELIDLLASSEDSTKLKLFEDTTKKGSVIISGQEEIVVSSKEHIYKILEKGAAKRQTAATLLNSRSSRSHTIFSIMVHVRETVDEEEIFRKGKLNLVDLAGSENIGRSGAVEKQAREAGNINQSLLTLGRVISCLVEGLPHIPYRESKLTRLLQDSLGGRTKTSMIATISPASTNFEETLSTLNYAARARNIINKPEANQKQTHRAVLKEYAEEVERLRRDLRAYRDKTGIAISQDNYREMTEKIKLINVLEEERDKQEEIIKELRKNIEVEQQNLAEEKYIVEHQTLAEQALLSNAQELQQTASRAAADVYKLHDAVQRKTLLEKQNKDVFVARCSQYRDILQNTVETFASEEKELCSYVQHQIDTFESEQNDLSNDMKLHLESICNESATKLSVCKESIQNNITDFKDDLLKAVDTAIEDITSKHTDYISGFKSTVSPLLSNLSTGTLKFKTMNENMNLSLNKHLNCVDESIKTNNENLNMLENISSELSCTLINLNCDEKEYMSEMNEKLTECDLDNERMLQLLEEQENILNKLSSTLVSTETMNQQFTEKSEKLKTNFDTQVQELKSNLSDQSNKTLSVLDNNKQTFESVSHLLDTINNDATKKQEEIDLFISQQTKSFEALIEKSKSQNRAAAEITKHNEELFCDFRKNFSADVQAVLNDSAYELSVNENKKVFLMNSSSTRKDVKKLVKSVTDVVKSKQNELNDLTESSISHVNNFFENALHKYVSTGNTPSRKDYKKQLEDIGCPVDDDTAEISNDSLTSNSIQPISDVEMSRLSQDKPSSRYLPLSRKKVLKERN